MASDKEEKIRARAYQIWQREGQPHGRHEQHWAQAERELENEGAAASPGGDMKVTPYNDPTRSGGPVTGGAYPSGSSGVSSGLQPGGAKPAGSPAAGPGSIGTGGGSTAGRPTGSAPDRRP